MLSTNQNYNSNMSNLIFHNLKTQASFFFKEKIKSARLALTDVTPAELLTEEATSGNLWPPDTRTMGVISRAAFEVDDYWRIVHIVHQRFLKFDGKNWRASYNALILLEHLLTHGPKSVAEEFQNDEDAIKEMGKFQYIDEKGFNWGFSVRKLSERIIQLLESESLLKEERSRARKLSREIKGFGSFTQQRSSTMDEGFRDSNVKTYGRCSSYCNDYINEHDKLGDLSQSFLNEERTEKLPEKPPKNSEFWANTAGDNGYLKEEKHPFLWKDELESTASLLSSIR
ncbi:epsin-3-like [Mangifera indica]|uniref:epsin-3-like n=1 Tax=Mangifera indica TaxID=29780 RepID=UPI001CF9FE02|nr:epsin-3-like [Mangifera indica]